jgi:hypothetical protein
LFSLEEELFFVALISDFVRKPGSQSTSQRIP